MKKVYLIGSLRNPNVIKVGEALRTIGFDVFDDWMAAGPTADDTWREYEIGRGHSFIEALNGYSARHVFDFDKEHLDSADLGVLVMPAGKSGHLELGYLIGQRKPGYILLDAQPERFDVMYKFATKVVASLDDLLAALAGSRR